MNIDKYKEVVEEVMKSREEIDNPEEREYFIEAIEVERETQNDLRERNKDENDILKAKKMGKIFYILISLICVVKVANNFSFKESLFYVLVNYLLYLNIYMQEIRNVELEKFQRFLIEVSLNQEDYLERRKKYIDGNIQELKERLMGINKKLNDLPNYYQEEEFPTIKDDIKSLIKTIKKHS